MKYDEDAYAAVIGRTVTSVTEEPPNAQGRVVLRFTFDDGADLEININAHLGYTDGPHVELRPIRFTPPGHSAR